MTASAPQRRVSPFPQIIVNKQDSDSHKPSATMDDSSTSSSSVSMRISSHIPESTLFRISSVDSEAASEAEPAWTCPRCSYLNVDAKNERCALCGSNDDKHIAESKQRQDQRRKERQKVYNNSLRKFSWRTNTLLGGDQDSGLDDENNDVSHGILSSTEQGLKGTESPSPQESFTTPLQSSSRPGVDNGNDVPVQQSSIRSSTRSILPTNSSGGNHGSLGKLMSPSSLTRQDAVLIPTMPSVTEGVVSRKSDISETTIRTSNRTAAQSRPPRPPPPVGLSTRSTPVRSPPTKRSQHPIQSTDGGDEAPPVRSRTMPPTLNQSPADTPSGPEEARSIRQYQSESIHASSMHHIFYKHNDKQSSRSIESAPNSGRPDRHAEDEAGASPLPRSCRSVGALFVTQAPLTKPPLPATPPAPVRPNDVENPGPSANLSPLTDYPLVRAMLAPPTLSRLPQDRDPVAVRGARSYDERSLNRRTGRIAKCRSSRLLTLMSVLTIFGVAVAIIILLVDRHTASYSRGMEPGHGDDIGAESPPPSSAEWQLALSVKGGPRDRLGSSVGVGGPVGNWVAMAGSNFVQVTEYVSSNLEPLGASIFLNITSTGMGIETLPRVSLSAERRRMVVTTNEGQLYVLQREVRNQNSDWVQAFIFNTTVSLEDSVVLSGQKAIIPSCGDISGSGLVVAGAGIVRTRKEAFAVIQLWDLEQEGDTSPSPITYLEVPADVPTTSLDLALSYEGDVLAVLSNGTVAVFREVQEPTPRWMDETPILNIGNGNTVLAVALSGHGLTLVVSTLGGTTIVYTYIGADGSSPSSHRWVTSEILQVAGTSLAISYDGRTILIGNEVGESNFGTVSAWVQQASSAGGKNDDAFVQVLEVSGSNRSAGFGTSVALPKNRQWDLMAIGANKEGGFENGQVHVYDEST